MNAIGYKVEARDKAGRVQTSTHTLASYPDIDTCLTAAKASASNCRGRYPWGNRVRIVPIIETP